MSWLSAWWVNLAPPVQSAIVSGCFTVLTAVVGVLVVLLQLAKQSKNTAKANRHTEALKLKKEIYQEVASAVRSADKLVYEMLTTLHRDSEVMVKARAGKDVKTETDEIAKRSEAMVNAVLEAHKVGQIWRDLSPPLSVFLDQILVCHIDWASGHVDYLSLFNRLESGSDIKVSETMSRRYYALCNFRDCLAEYLLAMRALLLNEVVQTISGQDDASVEAIAKQAKTKFAQFRMYDDEGHHKAIT